MARFELKEGTSRKFWEVLKDDEVLVTRWGRIGSEGQEKKQKFKNSYEARDAYQKLVQDKVKKGYKRIPPKNTGPKPKSNPELEAAILGDLDNENGYLVYGDWLQAQGDPRGELMALQHALLNAKGAKAARLSTQVDELIAKHRDLLLGTQLGPMRGYETLSVQWHLGFIQRASVRAPYDDGADPDFDVARSVALLLAHPSARFLQELTLGVMETGRFTYGNVTKAIAKAAPKALRSLFLGDFRYPHDTELSWTEAGKLLPLYKAVPQLRSLRIRAGSLELGKVDLPELREFIVETGGLPLRELRSIVRASWPKLERLEVWFGRERYGAEGGVDDLQPLLDGQGLGNLQHLALRNAEFTDELARALPKSKVLKQLKSLDLSMGTLTDEGAQVLAANAAAFKHLESLYLSRNLLGPKGTKLVAKLCPKVIRHSQRGYDENYRYAAVGE